MAVTQELVFVRREAFETHRAPCVKLVGADAELGPESVAETVSESRRGVVIDARGVDIIQEFPCGFAVFCDNRFCMTGTVSMNVLNSLICFANNLPRKN